MQMLARPAPARLAVPWASTAASYLGPVVVALVIAGALDRDGWAAVHVAAAILLPLGWALVAPRTFAVALLIAMVVIEPDAFDLTASLSKAWYQFPLRLADLLPLQMTPIEVAAVVVLGSLLVRNSAGRRERWASVPPVAFAVPLLIIAGMGYGIMKGAPPNLIYHEARGLIFTVVAFAITVEASTLRGTVMTRVALATTAVLGLILIARYFLYIRSGSSPVALEFAYAHESVLFLAGGVALAAALWMSRQGTSGRWLFLAYGMLMVAAILVTGRRAGTAVLLSVIVMSLALLLRRRPVLGSVLTLIAAVCLSAYLAAFWNTEYGARAQPARAIRSQFDPTPRDLSSDLYRRIEKQSIVATIERNPVLGVGFGRPFQNTQPLPRLSFWSLQQYVTHQSVLWLWLKMGFLGIALVLSVWLIAAGRAVRAFVVPRDGSPQVLPVMLCGVFAAYLLFATLDITFASTRTAAPLGVALALAFVKFPPWTAAARPSGVTP